MDYDAIEKLVVAAKTDDDSAKEELIEEFRPFINSISRKTFINSYEISDLQSECYKTILKCIKLYDTSKHRFVAYATNSIKNSMSYLIRGSINRSVGDGPAALIMDDLVENTLSTDENLEDIILMEDFRTSLKNEINRLGLEDKELVTYVFLNGNSLKKYSEAKSISYSKAVRQKNALLSRLKVHLNIHIDFSYKN